MAVGYMYIVECSDGSLYVGSTRDLERRLWEHNEGLGAAYTRRRRPVSLVWSTYYARIDQAYAFEKQVQNWGRAKRQALIDGRIDDLSVLGSRSEVARAIKEGAEFVTPFGRPAATEDSQVPRADQDVPTPPDDDPWTPPAPWVS